MRKFVALFLFVLLSAFAFGQDKYDIYEPLLYEPDVYVPKDTGAPLDMHPYVDTTVHADLSSLVDFIDLSKKYPDSIREYDGDFQRYIKLASKLLAKDKPLYDDLSHKKSMRYFTSDWNKVKYLKFKALFGTQLRQGETSWQILLNEGLNLSGILLAPETYS